MFPFYLETKREQRLKERNHVVSFLGLSNDSFLIRKRKESVNKTKSMSYLQVYIQYLANVVSHRDRETSN